MPLRIRITNLNRRRRIQGAALKKTVLRVLRSYGNKEALIDITIVGNRKIKALNKKYMGKDVPTDVISFLLDKDEQGRKDRLVGDIYISSDMAAKNARRFKTKLGKELFRYVIHGVLHLLGFDDETLKEKNRIEKLEEKFLKWHSRNW